MKAVSSRVMCREPFSFWKALVNCDEIAIKAPRVKAIDPDKVAANTLKIMTTYKLFKY